MENNQQLMFVFWAVEITAFAIIATICILIYHLRRNTLMLSNLKKSIENSEETDGRFNGEQAEQWFEKGDLTTLNQYCESYMKETPNSVQANWYFALSHYGQEEYELAREYFENVIRINPLWRDGAIVYLQEIASKIGTPSNRTLH